jgi:NAD-dependent deacetylase
MCPQNAFARLLADSRRAVAFTGAGISTESGIPDFRSPGGVWSRMKPIMFDEFVNDEGKRREAWRRAFSGVAGWTGAKPNEGHYALARLIAQGRVAAVITQNVDNLHQESGVPMSQVLELHGNASYAACLECGLRHELETLKQSFLGRDEIPVCRECGGLVKVATISFGQAMPQEIMRKAEAETLACDLFIVLGSSLVIALPIWTSTTRSAPSCRGSRRRISGIGDVIPDRHGAEAQQQRKCDVAHCLQPPPVARQQHGLQAERGEGRESAAHAGQNECAGFERNAQPAAILSQRREKADHERSEDVNQDGAPGKIWRKGRHGQGHPIPRHAAKRAA